MALLESTEMKNIVLKTPTLVLLLLTTTIFAQKHHNTKKGFAAEGYDVVAYFDNEAIEGDKAFSTVHGGVNYKFGSAANLEKFKQAPEMYLPQYGGYCAYAVGKTGKKVAVNPKTFEIRNGKLYLFYNAGKNNTLEFWLRESPDELVKKADANWKKIIKSK